MNFSDNIEAYHDLWVIGDDFLRETIDELFSLRKTVRSRASYPYIFKNFNVRGYYVTSGITNIICRVTHALVEALNERVKLPKYVLVVNLTINHAHGTDRLVLFTGYLKVIIQLKCMGHQ